MAIKSRDPEWDSVDPPNQPAWIRTSAVHEQEDRVLELDTGGRLPRAYVWSCSR